VAIVRAHFPFVRAYRLAGELCASAKRTRRDREYEMPAADQSWLDFQVVLSTIGDHVSTVRSHDLGTVEDGRPRLLWRPWRVVPDGKDTASFDRFRNIDRELRAHPDRWANNRLKRLRNEFERSAESYGAYAEHLRSRHADPSTLAGMAGIAVQERSPLYDVLETRDYLAPALWELWP
jgi:hypothetical protein